MISPIRPYLAVLSARCRMLLQYRASAIAGFGCQWFFGFVRVMIFDAFYQSGHAQQPMSYEEVVTYIWLGQAFLLVVLFGVDTDIQAMIRSGTVAYELVRPVNLYAFWFSRSMALRVMPVIMRGTPMLLVAGLFLGLKGPASSGALLMAFLALGLALLLASAISVLLTTSLLWTISGEGITRLAPAAMFFFSGIVIPLPLFPNWAQPILNALPFRGLIDVPFRLYMGNLSMTDGLWAMAQQVLWIIGFIVIGRALLARGMKRLVVQGG